MAGIVVITGLAQGMGRGVAERLGRRGWSIAGFDVDEEGLASLASELDACNNGHLLERVDITERKAVRAFRDRVLERFGHVDVVLSNAGIAHFGPLEETDLDKALRCLEINVIGMASLFQAFIPSMRLRHGGRLIAMSSLVGQIPFPFESIYSASKFAVEGLVHSMRLEVEPFGIRVGLIHPAQVSTAFAAKSQAPAANGSPYEERVGRFLARDEELIQSAPTPAQAADRIARVVEARRPPLSTRIDAMSTFFMALNRFLPTRLRDAILLRHMDIRTA